MPLLECSIPKIQFSALFFYMLLNIDLKFCIWLCFTVLQIKFECRQFLSIFVGVMPLLELKYWKYAVFRIFLLHALIYRAKILHMTLFFCTTDQVPVLSIFINFCWSYALLKEYWKYTVFGSFLLHTLTYWVEILHMTLFYCTTDQVPVSLICINFCGICPFWKLAYL